MTKILERIGFVGAVITRPISGDPDHDYEAVDGHLRKDLSAGSMVPNLVTDLTEDEAREILATFDPVSSLALPDNDRLSELLTGLKGLSVPLTEIGWPEFRLEQVLGDGWTPSRSATEQALDDATAGGIGTTGGNPGGASPTDPGAGFKPFTVPLSVEQEKMVREAVGVVKKRDKIESSGEALARIVKEWTDGQNPP